VTGDAATTTDAFGSERARDYLRRREMPSALHPDGVVVAPLPTAVAERPLATRLQAWLSRVGPNGSTFVIQVRSDRRVPRPAWQDAIGACNAWNVRSRVPKAWLVAEDWESGSDATVVLEATLPVGHGIPQGAFDQFADAVLIGAREFWEWAEESAGWARP
jgi:Putative bacterial sensory transduction regulator